MATATKLVLVWKGGFTISRDDKSTVYIFYMRMDDKDIYVLSTKLFESQEDFEQFIHESAEKESPVIYDTFESAMFVVSHIMTGLWSEVEDKVKSEVDKE